VQPAFTLQRISDVHHCKCCSLGGDGDIAAAKAAQSNIAELYATYGVSGF